MKNLLLALLGSALGISSGHAAILFTQNGTETQVDITSPITLDPTTDSVSTGSRFIYMNVRIPDAYFTRTGTGGGAFVASSVGSSLGVQIASASSTFSQSDFTQAPVFFGGGATVRLGTDTFSFDTTGNLLTVPVQSLTIDGNYPILNNGESEAASSVTFSSNSNVSGETTSIGLGTVNVDTATFNPVPEPSAAFLSLIALTGLLRRQRA